MKTTSHRLAIGAAVALATTLGGSLASAQQPVPEPRVLSPLARRTVWRLPNTSGDAKLSTIATSPGT